MAHVLSSVEAVRLRQIIFQLTVEVLGRPIIRLNFALELEKQNIMPRDRVVVSVSTSRPRDGLENQRLVSVSGGRRLGLGQLRLVPKTNFQLDCAGHINKTYACERALDVVSLCCSYYCSSY